MTTGSDELEPTQGTKGKDTQPWIHIFDHNPTLRFEYSLCLAQIARLIKHLVVRGDSQCHIIRVIILSSDILNREFVPYK
jgi:hypothetical protein